MWNSTGKIQIISNFIYTLDLHWQQIGFALCSIPGKTTQVAWDYVPASPAGQLGVHGCSSV